MTRCSRSGLKVAARIERPIGPVTRNISTARRLANWMPARRSQMNRATSKPSASTSSADCCSESCTWRRSICDLRCSKTSWRSWSRAEAADVAHRVKPPKPRSSHGRYEFDGASNANAAPTSKPVTPHTPAIKPSSKRFNSFYSRASRRVTYGSEASYSLLAREQTRRGEGRPRRRGHRRPQHGDGEGPRAADGSNRQVPRQHIRGEPAAEDQAGD